MSAPRLSSPRAHGIAVLADDSSLFTGRNVAVADICSWLRRPRNQSAALVVTGGSGSGKSSVLSRVWTWSAIRAEAAGETAPGWASLPTGHGLSFNTGAWPLAAGQPPEPGSIDVAINAYGRTTGEAFEELCVAAGCAGGGPADLLTVTRRRPRPMVAIIDGVDTAADPEHFTTSLLGPLVRAAPEDGLKLLIGARPRVGGWLGDAPQIIDLDQGDYADQAEIQAYAVRCLTELDPGSPYRLVPPGHVAAVANRIAVAAGRSFLVALIVARNLATRPHPVDPNDPTWRNSLPMSPEDAVAWDLSTRFHAQDSQRAADLLLPLAYAEGAGLPWEGVWAEVAAAVSGRPYTDADLVWLRRNVGWYVLEVGDAGRLVYRPTYRAVTDYLRSGRPAAPVHAAIAGALANSTKPGPGGTLEWAAAHPYTRQHLAVHAAAAGSLDEVLLDPHYLRNADRSRLLAALPAARSPQARAAGDAYRQVPPYADEVDYLAHLELAAYCTRAASLAQTVTTSLRRSRVQRPWSTRWAHWSEPRPCRLMPGGHAGAVLTMTTLPVTGRRLVVTGGEDGTLRVWDLAAGRMLGSPLTANAGAVRALAATMVDGRPIAIVGGRTGSVYRWDLAAGEFAMVATDSSATITAAALVRLDDRAVAVTGAADGTLSVWDLYDGEPLIALMSAHAGPVRAIATEYLGSRPVAVTVGADRIARAWHLGNGESPVGAGDVGTVSTLSWPGRAFALTADGEGALDLWDLGAGTQVEAPRAGPAGQVDAIASAVLAGRPVAVTGGPDQLVRVWDLGTGQPLFQPLTGHDGAVTAVALSDGDPPIAISGGADGTVRAWDVSAEDLADPGAAWITGVTALSPGTIGSVVVATAAGEVRVLDNATGQQLGPPVFAPPGSANLAVAVPVGGRMLLVTGGVDGRLRRWDLTTAGLVGRPLIGTAAPIVALAACALQDRAIGVSLTEAGSVDVCDLITGDAQEPVSGNRGTQFTALTATTADDRPLVILGSADGETTMWDISSARRNGILLGNQAGSVTAVAAICVGSRLVVASGGVDQTVRLWNIKIDTRSRKLSHRVIDAFEGPQLHAAPSKIAVRLSQSGTPMVVIAADAAVWLWSESEKVDRIDMLAPVTDLAFGEDGTLVIGTARGVATVAVTPPEADVVNSSSWPVG